MRPIDADSLIQRAEDILTWEMLERINAEKTVETVRHGHFDHEKVFFHGVCSHCKCVVTNNKYDMFLDGVGKINYCPNCGTKMDEKDDE